MSAPEDLKLCINCKHHSCEPDYRNYNGLTVNEYGVMPDICKAPQNILGIELVRGHQLLRVPECNAQRADTTIYMEDKNNLMPVDRCRKEGRWWEAKPQKKEQVLTPSTDKYANI